jgi:transposase
MIRPPRSYFAARAAGSPYLTDRISNAVTEELHTKIQRIKYSSRGFRDRERFKLPIYFHCRGVDLDPRPVA